MTAADFHAVLTVLFFLVFIGMVVWVYLPRRKRIYQRAADLPFVAERDPLDSRGEADR